MLCAYIKSGSSDAFETLAARYEKIIYFYINNIFFSAAKKNPVSDFDDLLQDCVLILYKSALRYDDSRNAKFSTFFNVCLKNYLFSRYREYKKNSGFSFVSLDDVRDNILFDSIPPELPDKTDLLEGIDVALTDFERLVFKLYLENNSYKIISETLGKNLKSIDNAIKRIKQKLKKKYNC